MGSADIKAASAAKNTNKGFVYLPLIAGWLVPGAGHFLLGKWGRGTLLAVSIISLFVLGLAMDGRLYSSAQDILEMLGMAGDLGTGLLYFVGRMAGFGGDPIQFTVAEYGTKFIEFAGLLNVIAAIDAHNLRTGRKQW
jgi:TM2 domain-containing membrane protein YozV